MTIYLIALILIQAPRTQKIVHLIQRIIMIQTCLAILVQGAIREPLIDILQISLGIKCPMEVMDLNYTMGKTCLETKKHGVVMGKPIDIVRIFLEMK